MRGDVKEVSVPLPHPTLPGSDWADAYQVIVEKPFASARETGEGIIEAFPQWYGPLLGLRNLLVAPFGLKHPDSVSTITDVLGIFPIVSEDKYQMVAGIDDKHLDFRIIIDLKNLDIGQSVPLTTAIKRHNLLGRSYLLAVLPFPDRRCSLPGFFVNLVKADQAFCQLSRYLTNQPSTGVWALPTSGIWVILVIGASATVSILDAPQLQSYANAVLADITNAAESGKVVIRMERLLWL